MSEFENVKTPHTNLETYFKQVIKKFELNKNDKLFDFIAEGCSRAVYRIKNTNYILKFTRWGGVQNSTEYETYQKLNTLQKAFFSETYFYCETHIGSFLISEFVEGETLQDAANRIHGRTLTGENYAKSICKGIDVMLEFYNLENISDIHEYNVIMTDRGYKIIDYGLTY